MDAKRDDIELQSTERFPWWHAATVYEIYPRSFQDSDGDGIGDLHGILQRLDYLQWLGVDAIWVTPIYPSPMKDLGYDVSDHTAVAPVFGTMDEFDQLIAEMHSRGMKLILDFVPNHTSDEHAWFADSRTSRQSAKRDWYIWRDPAPDGGPPNNWLSNFGGSAWTFDEPTGQYYYHAFLPEQPDLNWRNPAVRQAQYNVLRFWFDRGVDGFRIDVVWHLIKDDQFRDNPANLNFAPGHHPYSRFTPVFVADRPEIHEILLEMRAVADEYDDRLLIGEIYLPVERLVAYYGQDLRALHLPYNFQLITAPWNARGIERMITEYEGLLPEGAWPNWVLGNHDQARIASRVGPAQARIAAILLLTLRGTPTIYYGDELGMEDTDIPPDSRQDPCGFDPDIPSRDPARTPMQWDEAPYAGFSSVSPWLPVNANFAAHNVASEGNDPHSMLMLYRRLLAMRRLRPSLRLGTIELLTAKGDLLAFLRAYGGERLLVVLNLGDQPHALQCAQFCNQGIILISSHLDRNGEELSSNLPVRPNEGLIAELTKPEPEEGSGATP